MLQYKNSWNFGMGFYADNFDILDNDYVMIIGAEFSDNGETGYKFRDLDTYKLRKCKHEWDAPFVPKDLYEWWYKNPVCVDRSSNISMQASWWAKTFSQPAFMIAECQDTPERLNKGRKCKSQKEIY